MQAIGYFFALPILYLIALLPFRLLYILSDFIFSILFYIIGYRKKVVYENLKRSFPTLSHNELMNLQKRTHFYLADLIVETLKLLTISRKSLEQRCPLSQQAIDLFNNYYHEKKSVILVLGHYANWEWGGHAFSLQCKQPLYVLYHPLENSYFNKLIVHMRTRFGTRLIDMRHAFREMVKNRNTVSATAFIADQTPPPEHAYWTTFLNQDTPVYTGTEKIAQKLNYPVVFVSLNRIKRGYYELNAEPLNENPIETKEGEITTQHTKRLEREIIQNPELWLWSHRRWKHTRPAGVVSHK